ncbi:unnamed protein product [Caenorhabditis brenneri]
MDRTYLQPSELESFITDEKFQLVDEIDEHCLLDLKQEGSLRVKIKKDESLHDGFVWSKTRHGKNREVLFRHQPFYKKILLFNTETTSVQAVELDQPFLRKQTVLYGDFYHLYYFLITDDDLKLPEELDRPVPKKRISKKEANMMRTVVMPFRNMTSSSKLCQSMGINVTGKQIANLARNSKDTLIGNSGPKRRTTIAMAEELEKLYPDQFSFEKDDDGLLSDLCFINIFDEPVQLFLSASPTCAEWDSWVVFVDSLAAMIRPDRKVKIEELLKETPSGLFHPSRIHVDTTFNLGDVYVTIVLGEINSFQTKNASTKFRVVPLGYMLHSKKSKCYHQKFATRLNLAFGKHNDPTSPRRGACLLADGEEALECYAEALNIPLIRCDAHILSLLRHNFKSNVMNANAKRYIWGWKTDHGLWKAGLLQFFTERAFRKGLRRIKGYVDRSLHDWLTVNTPMLFNSASNYAKMKAGHLLQYSTNNQNETFNKIIKDSIKKKHTAPQLIEKLDQIFDDKIAQCWYAASGYSEHVQLSQNDPKWNSDQKLNHLKSIGLAGPRIHLIDVPPSILKRFCREKICAAEALIDKVVLVSADEDDYNLKDVSLTSSISRYLTVCPDENKPFVCSKCPDTMPDFVCHHILFVLLQLQPHKRKKFWKFYDTQALKNTFGVKGGSKPSDRFGLKRSANNHVRTIKDVTTMSVFDGVSSGDSDIDDSTQKTTNLLLTPGPRGSSPVSSSSILSPSNNTSTASTSVARPRASGDLSFSPKITSTPDDTSLNSSRRSGRQRVTTRRYSPFKDGDDSTISSFLQ